VKRLIEKVAVDYAELQAEDKYDLMIDIFENRQLKQAVGIHIVKLIKAEKYDMQETEGDS
jgi:hypothetical protein